MMIPSVFLSATARKRSATARSATANSTRIQRCRDNISACDVISVRIRRRRRSSGKTTFYPSTSCSVAPPKPLMLLFVAIASFFFASKVAPVHSLSAAKNQWINNSLQYYNRVTRGAEHVQKSPTYLKAAMENYFALEKIRDNKPHHAEYIYRRLMRELQPSDIKDRSNDGVAVEDCEFSQLAVPTLLLGLLLQREERFEDARTVFQGFCDAIEIASDGEHQKCSCCARVIQAYAMFEMKQDNPLKAVELILKAVRMDRKLRTILKWKVFREAMVHYRTVQRERQQLTRSHEVLAVTAM